VVLAGKATFELLMATAPPSKIASFPEILEKNFRRPDSLLSVTLAILSSDSAEIVGISQSLSQEERLTGSSKFKKQE
jgi:hypothetical protein